MIHISNGNSTLEAGTFVKGSSIIHILHSANILEGEFP
jgi:hypothetical protein